MAPGNDNDPIDSRSTSSRLNPIPGEVVLAHQGVIWKEGAISKLSSLGLAATAQTGVAPGLDEIIDTDIDNDLPGLPVVHRERERRNSERMKARMGNNLNDQKRKRITLQAWNQLFSLLDVHSQRFFDKHMFSCKQRISGKRVMEFCRGRNYYGINVMASQNI